MAKAFYLETFLDNTQQPAKLYRKVYFLSAFEAVKTNIVKLTCDKVQELRKDPSVMFSWTASAEYDSKFPNSN